MPIERLAQLLVQYARDDAALPRRSPANDDALHAQYVDDMFNRIEALPELRREAQTMRIEPQVPSPVIPTTAVASNEDLEELVAIALTSAQDAEDISRDAAEASRKAQRGMFVAILLAAVGIAIASAATISARLYDGGKQQMADIARQVRTLGDLQHQINDRLTVLHASTPVQEANAVPVQPPDATPVQQSNAASAEPAGAAHVQQHASAALVQHASAAPAAPRRQIAAVPSSLPPLKAVPVSVLPAEPAAPQPTSVTTNPSHTAAAAPMARTEAPAASSAPSPSYAAYTPPAYTAHVVSNATWRPYHPRRPTFQAVALPRPMAFLIGTVRHEVRTLLP